MFKRYLFCVLFFLFLMQSGCAEFSSTSVGRIVPPPVQTCPLSGTWQVAEELDNSSKAEEMVWKWTGSNVKFTEDLAVFGGRVWEDLSYKVKRVNAVNYLAAKYVTCSRLAIAESRVVDVVTVYADSKFLGELMKLDESSMVFFIHNKGFLLKKVADEVGDMFTEIDRGAGNLDYAVNEGVSGVFLGLRIPTATGYIYRTLWVAVDDGWLHRVLVTDQLFYPRTSGFWELDVEDSVDEGRDGNILRTHNISAASPEISSDPDLGLVVINYLGNDYVAIEKEISGISRLMVLPVDKLSSPEAINIKDLMGDDGLSFYRDAREGVIAGLSDEGISLLREDELGESFSLVRENGYWFLFGRVNYQRGDSFEHTDFKLKTIPPTSLVFYDTLFLNWRKVKDRVPDAEDAFASPNKDIILVKTKNKLKVYTLDMEELADQPLTEIDFSEGTSLVMAEWATGFYVEDWEEAFLSFGARVLLKNEFRMH